MPRLSRNALSYYFGVLRLISCVSPDTEPTFPPVWAPNLREWMIEHKLENVVEGLKQYPYKKDDWLNSVPKELADKLRERLN